MTYYLASLCKHLRVWGGLEEPGAGRCGIPEAMRCDKHTRVSEFFA